jgi:hypothetical protein
MQLYQNQYDFTWRYELCDEISNDNSICATGKWMSECEGRVQWTCQLTHVRLSPLDHDLQYHNRRTQHNSHHLVSR